MDKSTTASPSNGVIVLQGTQNYLEWLYTIEMAAKCGIQDVWQYINPTRASDEAPAIPRLEERPLPSHVNPGASTISQLEGTQIDDFKFRLAEWREKKAEIDETKRLLGAVQNKVLGSISEKLLPQLKGRSTVYEILLYLNKRFRPTDQARRQEVILKWNDIKEIPSDKTIMQWLDHWELTYAEAKEIKLPHVESPQAQYDFLYAVQKISEAWAEMKLADIDDQAKDNLPVTDLYDLIESFRHKQRLVSSFSKEPAKSIGGTNSSGVFSAHEDKKSTILKGRDEDGQRACLCGSKHQFENCFYINFKNTTRPSTFKYKQDIFDKINGN